METDILTYHQNKSQRTRDKHISQLAICAKIDAGVFLEIEQETMCGGITRNRLINAAIHYYLQELDKARRNKAINNNR